MKAQWCVVRNVDEVLSVDQSLDIVGGWLVCIP